VCTRTHEAGAWCSTWWCAAWVTGHDVTVELFAIISWQMQFMGLLLVTWGYYLEHGVIVCEKFKKHSFEVISKYFDYLLGTQKTLCLGTTCVFRKISFFFRFFAALKVCCKLSVKLSGGLQV